MMDKVVVKISASTRRVCSAGGLDHKLKKRIHDLMADHASLKKTIIECKKEESLFLLWRTLELGSRIVKHTMEIALGILEKMTGKVGVAIKTVYDISTTGIDIIYGGGAYSAVELTTKVKIEAIKKHLGAKHKATKALGLIDSLYSLSKTGKEIYDFYKGNDGASGIRSARLSAISYLKRSESVLARLIVEYKGCGYDTRVQLA